MSISSWNKGFAKIRSYFVLTFSATLNVPLLLLDVWYRGDDIYWKPSLFIVGHLERQPFPTGDSWIQMHTTYQAFLRSRIGCLLISMMFSLHYERYHSCDACLEKKMQLSNKGLNQVGNTSTLKVFLNFSNSCTSPPPPNVQLNFRSVHRTKQGSDLLLTKLLRVLAMEYARNCHFMLIRLQYSTHTHLRFTSYLIH